MPDIIILVGILYPGISGLLGNRRDAPADAQQGPAQGQQDAGAPRQHPGDRTLSNTSAYLITQSDQPLALPKLVSNVVVSPPSVKPESVKVMSRVTKQRFFSFVTLFATPVQIAELLLDFSASSGIWGRCGRPYTLFDKVPDPKTTLRAIAGIARHLEWDRRGTRRSSGSSPDLATDRHQPGGSGGTVAVEGTST